MKRTNYLGEELKSKKRRFKKEELPHSDEDYYSRRDEYKARKEREALSGGNALRNAYHGKYMDTMEDEVRCLARFGLTDPEIAEFYNVSLSTLEKYKREVPEFRKALDTGRMLDSMKVVDSLHKQALGYHIDEFEEAEHVTRQGEVILLKKKVKKYVQPSATAAIYLLKTRHGDKWMDVIKSEQSQHLNITVKNVDFSDMSTEELLTLKKLGIKRIPPEFNGTKQIELPQQDVRGN